MKIKHRLAGFLLMMFVMPIRIDAQLQVIENRQYAFPHTIPAGNYSGITWLGGDLYAVVSDKSEEDGFFVFEIKLDMQTGEIRSVRNMGFRSSGYANRDDEGIAYNNNTNTIWISGEADNLIREYNPDGSRTGRTVPQTDIYKRLPGNLGLEALSYNAHNKELWTCNESDTVYIQSYNELLQPVHTCRYHMDAPEANKAKALFYAHGIGTLCALDDGTVLLLEREFFVPHKKIGSFVNCKLFHYIPGKHEKNLLARWKTKLNLTSRNLANYEGMCLGPTLNDGSRVILLVADSQNQYAGVLKDWIKSLKLTHGRF